MVISPPLLINNHLKKTSTYKGVEQMGLNLKPLSDRVVVEPAKAEEKSSGGIILPDKAHEKPQQGKVVAV